MSTPDSVLTPADFYRADGYQTNDSLGWLVRAIQQSIVREASKRLGRHGLTHAQWSPLIRMYFCGGQYTTAGLAKELDLDAGATTRMLDRLEAKELIRRVRSTTDRRVVLLELTEQGRRLTSELPAVLSEIFNAHLSGFSREEWQSLLGLLRRVQANAELLRRQDDAHVVVGDPEE